MYRSDGFLVPQVEKVRTGIYHDLAEAIRRGCAIRPKKVKRRLRHGECGADALGAAAAGCGMSKRYTLEGIAEIFPELGGYVQHPISGRPGRLSDVVVSLNDQTDYTREQIADWLCRLGGCEHPVSSFFPSPPSPDQPLQTQRQRNTAGAKPTGPKRHDRAVGLGFGRYHKLAVAMRRGCLLRPKKVKGFWKQGDTMACALGAVAEGAGFRKKDIPWNKMWDTFPELKTFSSHPLTTVRMELWHVISTLSEDTNYSREEIADWLCVEGGCKHPLDRPLVIKRGRTVATRVLCACAVCRDLGFVPDLVA